MVIMMMMMIITRSFKATVIEQCHSQETFQSKEQKMFGNNGRKFVISLPKQTKFHSEVAFTTCCRFYNSYNSFLLFCRWSVLPRGLSPVFGAIYTLKGLFRARERRYDFWLSCVTQKEEILKFLGTNISYRFQIPLYIQDGGLFCLLIVDVGLLVVGAWQVAYSLLTYLRAVRMIPFSLITDILSKIQNSSFQPKNKKLV